MDLDLEKFFDRVNHAVLMAPARRVKDKSRLVAQPAHLVAAAQRGAEWTAVSARRMNDASSNPLSRIRQVPSADCAFLPAMHASSQATQTGHGDSLILFCGHTSLAIDQQSFRSR